MLAAAIPEWEAVYEPGNVSDYLIGYANSEAAAKGAAIAWALSQTDKTADHLGWEPQSWSDEHDAWFDMAHRLTAGMPLFEMQAKANEEVTEDGQTAGPSAWVLLTTEVRDYFEGLQSFRQKAKERLEGAGSSRPATDAA